MVKYLSNYNGEYRIFKISRSHKTTLDILSDGYDVCEISEDEIVFMPDNTIFELSCEDKQRMAVFSEYDVVDINSRGVMYRWYSVIEGDAGIATTPICNSNCIMCPASENERKQKSGISTEILKKVIHYMPKDLWYFTITGGEPTLIGEERFLDILNYVKNELPFTKIQLLTNGRTLGDKSFFNKFLEVQPKNMKLAIPIHGSTPDKHDYITQAPNSFSQTIRAISSLLYAKVETEIRIVVSKLNCDDIYNIAKLIVKMFPDVSVVNFVGLEMRGNCVANADEVLISYEDAFEYSKKAIKLLIKNGIDVGLYNFPYCMIERKFWPIAKKSISAYKSMFYSDCDKCDLRNECCGIFKATMDFYKPKVYPIQCGENK